MEIAALVLIIVVVGTIIVRSTVPKKRKEIEKTTQDSKEKKITQREALEKVVDRLKIDSYLVHYKDSKQQKNLKILQLLDFKDKDEVLKNLQSMTQTFREYHKKRLDLEISVGDEYHLTNAKRLIEEKYYKKVLEYNHYLTKEVLDFYKGNKTEIINDLEDNKITNQEILEITINQMKIDFIQWPKYGRERLPVSVVASDVLAFEKSKYKRSTGILELLDIKDKEQKIAELNRIAEKLHSYSIEYNNYSEDASLVRAALLKGKVLEKFEVTADSYNNTLTQITLN